MSFFILVLFKKKQKSSSIMSSSVQKPQVTPHFSVFFPQAPDFGELFFKVVLSNSFTLYTG